MKRTAIISMLGVVCLALSACGTPQTTVSSEEQPATIKVQSEQASIEQKAEEESSSIENTSEENKLSAEQSLVSESDPVFYFFCSPDAGNIQDGYHLSYGSFDFFADDVLVATYEDLDLNQSLCFELDESLFGNATTLKLVTHMDGLEMTRLYDHIPGCSNVYGISIGVGESGLDSCLAGGVITYAGTYVDRQGTDDVYSDLTISMHFPESHLCSDMTYDIEIGLFRLTTIRGTGVMEGDVMHFIPNENEAPVYGDIIIGEYSECATFTVTESNWGYISAGESFDFPETY